MPKVKVIYPNKYQKGGKAPIYVSDPNDPRLKAYQDSLTAYNITNDIRNKAQSTGVLDLNTKDHTEKGYMSTNVDTIKPNSTTTESYSKYKGDPGFDYAWFNRGTQHEMYPETINSYHNTRWYDPTVDWSVNYKQPQQPIEYRPQEEVTQYRTEHRPAGTWLIPNETTPAKVLKHANIQQLPISQTNQFPTNISQQIVQEHAMPDYREEVWSSPVTNYNGQGFRPAGFYKQDIQQYGGGYNNINSSKMTRVKITPPKKQTGGYTYQRAPQPPQELNGQYTQEQWNSEQGKAYRDTYGTQTGFDAPMQMPTGFNIPQSGTQMPVQQPAVQQQSQGDNWHTGEGTDYSIDSVRQAAYGGPISSKIQDQNSFDNRWNPDSYQGQIGVNPDPDPYARTSDTLPEAKEGGPNVINAEKQEQVLGNFTPDGLPSLMNVDGPPHTAGGKDVTVPDNSFIFSDTKSLKIKDSQILKAFNQSSPATPAQIAKQYKLQKFTKVIADPDADPISKKTAQLMVGNYQAKLNQLASYQESLKDHLGVGDNQQPQQQMAPQMQQFGGNQDVQIPYVNSFPDNNFTVIDKKSPIGYAPITDGGYSQMQPDTWSPQTRELPSLPPVVPDPQNLSIAGQTGQSTDSGIGSYTKVPFTAPTPDKWGVANSLVNMAMIHRYPAWEAPIGAVAPNTVFEDPTRAIAAQQELANSAGQNAALSGNSKAARSNQAQIQGIAGSEAANILGATGNRNTQIANQASREAADISNRLQQEQAQRLNRLYQGNVISAQQYDNATREARNDFTRQSQTAFNDRSKADFLNKTSPYFYYDPVSGARKFKSKEAEAAFNNQVLGTGAGYSPDIAEKVNKTYSELIKQPAYQSEHGRQEALKLAQRMHGLGEHTTISSGPYGAPKGSRESGVYAGPQEEKFGGKIQKKQYGGMKKRTLQKFVSVK